MIHEKFYMVLFKGYHPRLQYAHKIMVHVIENEVECTLEKNLQKGLVDRAWTVKMLSQKDLP